MRVTYMSDLHLESETYAPRFGGGDVLVIAGDLCHARCLDPARSDGYSVAQRSRVMRFLDAARPVFVHIVMVAGNHEHYDGVFEDTGALLRRHLPGVTVLDDDVAEIGGCRFFGSTLWTDFSGGDPAVLDGVRRRMGEYFFVRTRGPVDARGRLPKLTPEDAMAAHRRAWTALQTALAQAGAKPAIVITHHAPSVLGANARFKGDALEAAYCSALDEEIARFTGVRAWIHGHTHVARRYRIGAVEVCTNARGLASKHGAAAGFSHTAAIEIVG